jgi:hypothetical protein
MSFEEYYNREWLHRHAYFELHRRRFNQSWEVLEPTVGRRTGKVLDTGGLGPLASYLQTAHGWTAHETKSDLRHPLSIPVGNFDLVICTETIEHIKDVESDDISKLECFNYSGVYCMLGEFARLMSPDGLLLVTTPNSSSYISLKKWLVGELVLMDPNHVREFSIRDLVRVAGEAGLEPRLVKTIDCWDASFGEDIDMLRKLLASRLIDGGVERGDNIMALFGRPAAGA